MVILMNMLILANLVILVCLAILVCLVNLSGLVWWFGENSDADSQEYDNSDDSGEFSDFD